jgi:hypothetical protein
MGAVAANASTPNTPNDTNNGVILEMTPLYSGLPAPNTALFGQHVGGGYVSAAGGGVVLGGRGMSRLWAADMRPSVM